MGFNGPCCRDFRDITAIVRSRKLGWKAYCRRCFVHSCASAGLNRTSPRMGKERFWSTWQQLDDANGNPNYEPVFQKFITSLDLQKNTFLELHVHHIDMSNFTSFGFQTEAWYHAVHSKVKYVSDMLETRIEEQEFIILTDSDIQYLRPSEVIKLVQLCKHMNLDYFGMDEGDGYSYNTGFYVVKNSKKTRDFFKHILHCLETEPYHEFGDQTVINREILNSDLKHEKIPIIYYVLGDSHVLPTSILHHAIGCKDINCKLNQMQRVHDKFIKT
jgi:hypothetical protein